MKIECPKCAKPFQVAEDKLTEEGIRIRCSSCGSVIRLKGKKREAPAAQKAEAWFAVLGGERVGPFGPKALAELVAKGKLDRETLLWKKGLAAWAKAGSISELAQLFGEAPVAPPQEELPEESTEDTGEVMFFPAEEARAAKPARTDDSGSWHQAPPPAKALTEDSTEAFFKDQGEAPQQHFYNDEIEIAEPQVEPVSLEDGVHKGARETLRDFSVMARLSSRSRRRSVFIGSGVAVLCLATLGLAWGLSDHVEFKGKQRELEWEGAKDFYGKPAAPRRRAPLPQQPNFEPKTQADPEAVEILPELDQDLSLDLGAVAGVEGISKEALKERFQEAAREGEGERVRPRVRGGDDWGSPGGGLADEEEGVGDLLEKREARREISPEAAPASAPAQARNGAQVAPSSDFLSRGGLVEERVAAEIKERKSDGTLWQTAVRNNIVRKINAERKRLQACADSAGASSGVRIILSLSPEGQITDISPEEGGAQFEACLEPILKGWKAGRRIPKAVKLPVKLHFE